MSRANLWNISPRIWLNPTMLKIVSQIKIGQQNDNRKFFSLPPAELQALLEHPSPTRAHSGPFCNPLFSDSKRFVHNLEMNSVVKSTRSANSEICQTNFDLDI